MVASCPSFRCSCRKSCLMHRSDCVQDLDYRKLIVLSLVTCDCCKPVNTCRDWAFSHSGLEVGLPAFQLPMFANAKHWRRFVRHACLRTPCLLWNQRLHSLPEAWGPWERQHAPPAHYGCIMLAKDRVVVSKLWITGYWLLSCDCCKSMKNCRESAFRCF